MRALQSNTSFPVSDVRWNARSNVFLGLALLELGHRNESEQVIF